MIGRDVFEAGDDALYRDLPAAETRRLNFEVWAWVLMPNHMHLMLVPADESGLAGALSRLHRRHAAFVNARARRYLSIWCGSASVRW